MAEVGGEPGAAPPPAAGTALSCVVQLAGSWLSIPASPSPLGAGLHWKCCLVLWGPSAAVMVVFLGRHLPALLEVFKKGEWVWLWG